MMLDRQEFKAWMIKRFDDPGIAGDNSALWIPEHDLDSSCEWFLLIQDRERAWNKKKFWRWCDSHLAGAVRCFYRETAVEEWWGFQDQRDIVIWSLKWL
jgi:hypothetical protein